jgi:maltose-binding protein MalE
VFDEIGNTQRKTQSYTFRWWSSLLVLVVISLASCSPAAPLEDQPVIESKPALPTQTPAPLPTPSPGPESSSRGEVVIWISYEPLELESFQAAIDSFALNHPDLAFALTYYPEDQILEAFQTLAPQGRGPTILIGPSRWGQGLYEAGDILDLSALIDADLEEDIFPAAWTQARTEFAVMGLPLELKGVLLYRNRSLVEQSPATVSDWIAAQADLAVEEGYETQLDMGFTYSGSFLSTCGGRLESLADRSQLWGPLGLCWLGLLSELGSEATPVFNSEADLQAFINGKNPWLIDLAERRPELRAALGEDNLSVNPWPVYSNQSLPLQGYVWTENIYVASGTPSANLEAAWAFARYMLSTEAQTLMADPSVAGHIPVVASVELDDPLMVESSAMLRSGVPWPLGFTDTEFVDVLETAVVNVVQQGSNPVFALNFAQESLGLPITLIPTATPAGQ